MFVIQYLDDVIIVNVNDKISIRSIGFIHVKLVKKHTHTKQSKLVTFFNIVCLFRFFQKTTENQQWFDCLQCLQFAVYWIIDLILTVTLP